MVMVRDPVLRIAIVGSGYTGLSTAVALAKLGHSVECVDSDAEKVLQISKGVPPFHEPGLQRELKALLRRRRLSSTTDTIDAVRGAQSVFICVGTPSSEDGSMDPRQVRSAAESIGEGLRGDQGVLVVVKSTVIPGTTESLIIPALEAKSGLDANGYRICVSPEFLREGRALEDSLHPSHVIIGQRDSRSGNALVRLLAGLRAPKLRTSLRTAEVIKYATNAFLATKVSFANEIANLCTRLELDADEVLRGMSMDPRINPQYLVPGVGFGGSCLPKDVRALVGLGTSLGYRPALLAALLETNDRQASEAVRLLESELGSLAGKRIAILGLSFKAGTDDVRETRAVPIADELSRKGATVIGYDPMAGSNFARLRTTVRVVDSIAGALSGADACVIQTAWPEFHGLKARDFAKMSQPIVIDGRRTWPRGRIPAGVRYRRIG